MTSIEWTHGDGYKGETWNPLRGCDKVSPGCKNCYAETFAERWRGIPGHPYEQGFDLRLVPAQLDKPLRWRKPRMVFVNSMSDLFHADVPYEYIAAVFGVMAAANRHVFQMLTKRDPRPFFRWLDDAASDGAGKMWPEDPVAWRRGAILRNAVVRQIGASDRLGPVRERHPLDNLWVGVSVENADYTHRIDWLREVPAAVRFLSLEPLLGPLDDLDLTGIHWVISGDESGHGARPAQEDWHRSIRDQCRAAGVPFFLKQRSEKGKKRSLPVLDGEQHAEFPEVRHG